LADPEAVRRMGEAGRERARFFTFERMIRGYETVYERVRAQRGDAH
jgi:glycosyltransferase involved in cell wall biosynthesis